MRHCHNANVYTVDRLWLESASRITPCKKESISFKQRGLLSSVVITSKEQDELFERDAAEESDFLQEDPTPYQMELASKEQYLGPNHPEVD